MALPEGMTLVFIGHPPVLSCQAGEQQEEQLEEDHEGTEYTEAKVILNLELITEIIIMTFENKIALLHNNI